MADLPELSAEAQRRFRTKEENALSHLQKAVQRDWQESSFQSSEEIQEQDIGAVIHYALKLFQIAADEYWRLRTNHVEFLDWLTILQDKTVKHVQHKWILLKKDGEFSFQVRCLPNLERALRDECGCWMLRLKGNPEESDQSRQNGLGRQDKAGAPAQTTAIPAKEPLRRGPKPDLERALRIAEIVRQVAPDGNWSSKLDEISEALDEAGVPVPRTWRSEPRQYRDWDACLERPLKRKVIKYHVDMARSRSAPETLA
jgi:hypothetical protein